MSSPATAPATQQGTREASPAAEQELVRWQRKLLPVMTGFIISLASIFFCFSAIHLYQVTKFIQTEHGLDIRAQIESEIARPPGVSASGEEVLQNSLLLLEADTLDKRYHEASALLLSRIWSRQLAFITGMVMAFLGAVFILGKMSESTSNISGEGGQWKVAITSASPGIILSFFGTTLLITSLLIRTTLDVSDGPAYVTALRRAAVTSNTGKQVSPAGNESGMPLDLNEIEKLSRDKAGSDEKKK
jgi:hypothetical protein